DEDDIRAIAIEVFARLQELFAAGVDADDGPLRTDKLGEQGGHRADTAADVGDTHPALQTGVEQGPARARSVQFVQDAQAVGGSLASRQDVGTISPVS